MLFDVLLFIFFFAIAITIVAYASDRTDSILEILLSYFAVFLMMLYPYDRISKLLDWQQIPFINSTIALILSILSIIPLYYLFLCLKSSYRNRHRHHRF